jgi:hypothetical protein
MVFRADEGRTRSRRSTAVVGLVAALVAAAAPSGAGTLGLRRKAVFGDEIPVLSIVSDSIGIGAEMGPLGRARHTFVRKLFDAGFVVHLSGRGLTQAADLADEYAVAVNADNFAWKAALVTVGTNDYAADRPLDEVRAGYAAFLDTVMATEIYGYRDQTLICVTPLQRAEEDERNGAGYTLEDVRVEIREVCLERGLPIWEGLELLPFDDGIALERPSRYFNDGIHPNRRGHKILGRALADRVLSYFEALESDPLR